MEFKDITEETLLLRLSSTEHDFVERKSKSDKGGWLQSAVAFANSTEVGWPAILFVGADDSGNPQVEPGAEMENLIKSVSSVLDRAYPAIYRYVMPVRQGERVCLAVIIPGSNNRPHFAGQSYIRVGTETKLASEREFSELIAQRNSRARKILEFKGKQVTLRVRRPGPYESRDPRQQVADCNQFFVTLRKSSINDSTSLSIPLESVKIAWDHEADQLMIVIEQEI